MNIMEPYIDNLLFETAVPIILVTSHDLHDFKEEPIEFLRRQQDYEMKLSSSKAMIDLVDGLCGYKRTKKD